MKAVGFFTAVFLSMLAVFLVATGEVTRWFSAADEKRPRILVRDSTEPAEQKANFLSFPLWDIKTGRRTFTIEGVFSQEDLQDSKVAEMRQVRLSDGRIEIPIHEGLTLPSGSETGIATGAARKTAAGGVPEAAASQLDVVVLNFDSAVYHNGKADGKPTRVVLRDGHGTANDGSQIEFDELVFSEGESGFLHLDSTQSVAIRNSILHLQGRNGLQGLLRQGGLETLSFHPPVVALLNVSGAEAEGEPHGVAVPPGERLAVTCQGALDVRFEKSAKGPTPATTSTVIRFQKDVVLYAVPGDVDPAALPGPDSSRFECQELVIEMRALPAGTGETRFVPVRAHATWPDGRVRAWVLKGARRYKVETDQLQWSYPEKSVAGSWLEGEAALQGRPTLQEVGGGVSFEAKSGRFRPAADTLVFETVRGTLDVSVDEERSSRDSGLRPAGRGAMRAPEGATGSRGPSARGRSRGGKNPERTPFAPREAAKGAGGLAALSDLWEVRTPQAEFRFRAPAAGGNKELAEIFASSPEPGGVVIASLEGAVEGSATPPLRITTTRLRYDEARRTLRLEGAAARPPRLELGKSWAEAPRIDLFPRSAEALFEGGVKARLEGIEALRAETEKPSTSAAASSAVTDRGEAGGAPSVYELTAGRLEVGFEEQAAAGENGGGEGASGEKVHFRFLHALASPEVGPQKVVVRSLSEPPFRFDGEEIYWDNLGGKAWFYGSSESGGDQAGAAPGSAQLAFQGGTLEASEIHFDQREWKAFLSDRVIIRVSDGDDSLGAPKGAAGELTISTGEAEVEFFEGLKEQVSGPPTVLDNLRRVRAMHAKRAPERHIEIRGERFVAKAEEVTWASETRRLRFFGPGVQEIEILHEEFSGPLRAKEIVYEEAKNLLVLRGEVVGEFTQAAVLHTGQRELPGARIEAASVGDSATENGPLVWHFEADSLEVQMRRGGADVKDMELVSMRAHDVRLREKVNALAFHGDELLYKEAERKIHIYSNDRRPQTFSRATDRIRAERIWILLTESWDRNSVRPESRLYVEFDSDVTAWLATAKVPSVEGLGELWKLSSNRLTLRIDPRQLPRSEHLIRWARATGNVTFESGAYVGMCETATYDEDMGQLVLDGTDEAKARLLKDLEPLRESPRVILEQDGTTWRLYE